MAVFITSLNSGSNGNCYYIGNEQEAVLIDAGISCRETEKRLKRLGLSIYKIKAIFITHEHADHIRGVSVLARKYQLPVYITSPTLRNTKLLYENIRLETFLPHEAIQVGDIFVTGFPKLHDAIDPHSFIVTTNNVTIGVFTDIGAPCQHVVQYFRKCQAIILESNYDEAMLQNGYYPQHLKKRISGDKGHLSNFQALELFKNYKPDYMSHVFLAHLSKDNNCPKLARELFEKHAGDTEIIVASRYEETPVYTLQATASPVVPEQATGIPLDVHTVFPVKSVKSRKKLKPLVTNQLSLFDLN